MAEQKKDAAAGNDAGAEKKEARKGGKMVRFRLFKDNDKYKEPVFVGVNGKGYLVQRGVTVEMPESVYHVLVNSQIQMDAAVDYSKEMESHGE